jgi:hypothetical protein
MLDGLGGDDEVRHLRIGAGSSGLKSINFSNLGRVMEEAVRFMEVAILSVDVRIAGSRNCGPWNTRSQDLLDIPGQILYCWK